MATKKDRPQWRINKNARDKRYNQLNIRQIKMNFNRNTEQEMIDFLDSQPNKNKYLKDLIAQDMMRGKKSGD